MLVRQEIRLEVVTRVMSNKIDETMLAASKDLLKEEKSENNFFRFFILAALFVSVFHYYAGSMGEKLDSSMGNFVWFSLLAISLLMFHLCRKRKYEISKVLVNKYIEKIYVKKDELMSEANKYVFDLKDDEYSHAFIKRFLKRNDKLWYLKSAKRLAEILLDPS